MKGILYSVVAALLIIPILGLILFNAQLTEKNIDINIRSNELEYFSISVEEDLNRFLKIAGKRALISAVSKVITEGTPLVDAGTNLTEMIVNGTLDGVIAPLIGTNNLNTWRENVTNISANSGFNMKIQNIEINITQNSSFSVLFDVNAFINISDSNLKMSVAKNLTAKVGIPIDDIEDPLFPLKTYSRVIRVIQISNFSNYTKDLVKGTNASGEVSGYAFVKSDFDSGDINSSRILVTDSVTGKEDIASQFAGVVSETNDIIPGELMGKAVTGANGAMNNITNETKIYLDETTEKVWNLQNLTLFVQNKYYKDSVDGPSFLDRLEGKLSLSSKYKYGLETFVDLDELELAELDVDYESSCVDYEYWKGTDGNSIRNGNYDPIFDWLKIDSNHENIYGVDKLIE